MASLGSPVPASRMGFACGWMAMAPMESEGTEAPVPALALKTARVSVSGVKVMEASGPAALVDFQTPAPVAPR